MPQEPSNDKGQSRVNIIGAVKTYLGFFVLLVLVVESVIGIIALNTQGQTQIVAIFCMLFVFLLLIAIVFFFAYKKDNILLRSFNESTTPAMQSMEDFCKQVSGYWWERIKPVDSSAISFVVIIPDWITYTVMMKGQSYNKDGQLTATWESVASCLKPSEKKIFYYWEGDNHSRSNEPYEGFGEISFNEFPGSVDSAMGFFSDTNMTNMKSTTKKTIEFQRSLKDEIQVMSGGNQKLKSELILKKLDGQG
jgi:hypothetical protein